MTDLQTELAALIATAANELEMGTGYLGLDVWVPRIAGRLASHLRPVGLECRLGNDPCGHRVLYVFEEAVCPESVEQSNE